MPSGPDRASVPAPAERRLDAVVAGRVQGVGYRYFVVDRARALGLSGWVANLPGGSVRTVAEGPEEALRRLLADLWDGPPAAWVESVSEAWSRPTGEFGGFHVVALGHRGD